MEISPPLSVHPHGQHCGVSLGERCCAPWGELGRISGTAPKKKGGEPRPQETGKRGGRNKQCCPEEARKRGGGKQRKKDKKFLSVNFPFSEQGISW